jgi:hypothetical protein
VVRQIVDTHRGHIAVEAGAAGGARFVVTLPTKSGPGGPGRPGSTGSNHTVRESRG